MLSLIKAEDKVICNSVSILLALRNSNKMLIIFCRLLDIGVAEIVETHLRDSNFLHLYLELSPDRVGCDVFPKLVCKNEIVFITPA